MQDTVKNALQVYIKHCQAMKDNAKHIYEVYFWQGELKNANHALIEIIAAKTQTDYLNLKLKLPIY